LRRARLGARPFFLTRDRQGAARSTSYDPQLENETDHSVPLAISPNLKRPQVDTALCFFSKFLACPIRKGAYPCSTGRHPFGLILGYGKFTGSRAIGGVIMPEELL
jgi:hypothetical protein